MCTGHFSRQKRQSRNSDSLWSQQPAEVGNETWRDVTSDPGRHGCHHAGPAALVRSGVCGSKWRKIRCCSWQRWWVIYYKVIHYCNQLCFVNRVMSQDCCGKCGKCIIITLSRNDSKTFWNIFWLMSIHKMSGILKNKPKVLMWQIIGTILAALYMSLYCEICSVC